ncbi:HAD family hydrolase [Calothrix rhizosoleniae]|uniref:HAD family hydrolase n=1 Tax=Calothrix rhizosoleniae TaxID=888997 RepID=UPI000B4A421C|nr:HAD family phosphatase [Calothrix rhizosoleniae]
MGTTHFDLIIFDCDGVLVDSERITNAVFAEMLNDLGLSLTLEDMFEQFVGNSMQQCLKMIETMLGEKPPSDFVSNYRQRTKLALQQQLKPVRGIRQTLDRLSLPYCVASSSDREKMETTLGITGILPYFQGKLFSVTEVERGKPFPDVYLYAAEKMNAQPSRCLVIEDTPIGVRGGVSAGMIVGGYAELMNAEKLQQAGAHFVFEDMSQIPNLIQSM